jgi:hypothetical protein
MVACMYVPTYVSRRKSPANLEGHDLAILASFTFRLIDHMLRLDFLELKESDQIKSSIYYYNSLETALAGKE